MHGMLSLAVLVAALAGLAGWVGYLVFRLYRACPAARSTAEQPTAGQPLQVDSAGFILATDSEEPEDDQADLEYGLADPAEPAYDLAEPAHPADPADTVEPADDQPEDHAAPVQRVS